MRDTHWPHEEIKNLSEWPKSPLFIKCDEALNLDAQAFLSFLEDPRFVARRVSVIRNGNPVPRSDFVSAQRVDRSKVEELFEKGATVTFREIHEWLEPVQSIAKNLHEIIGHPVQANAYLTPAGRQGFSHHWDTHAAIIQQTQGYKTWDINAPCLVDPIDPEQLFTSLGLDPEFKMRLLHEGPEFSFTLSKGDWLWVPRGWIHNPFAPAGDDPSLHITYGILEVTTRDVISAIISALSIENEELRTARPPRAVVPGESELAKIRDNVVKLLGSMTIEDVHSSIKYILSH